MQHWNWGIPVAIPEPPNAGAQPLGWEDLKFNQIGLFDIRRRIGVFASEPGVYDKHRTRFDAADLAWFASGLSTDVIQLTQNAFAHEFNILRQGMPSGQTGSQARAVIRTRIQKLTFYESEFTRIRSYKHLSPQIDRERFNGVLYKL